MSSSDSQARQEQVRYGEHWGEGAARCFSIQSNFLDKDQAIRLMPVPESFMCPISSAIMEEPVATVDGSVYEREHIERWFRTCAQQRRPLTSPATGLPLQSVTLMPLMVLRRAIETYLEQRPEIRTEQLAGRSSANAAQVLQVDLLDKQAMHASQHEELQRLWELHQAQSTNPAAGVVSTAASTDQKEEENGQPPRVMILGRVEDPPKEPKKPGNDGELEKRISPEATPYLYGAGLGTSEESSDDKEHCTGQGQGSTRSCRVAAPQQVPMQQHGELCVIDLDEAMDQIQERLRRIANEFMDRAQPDVAVQAVLVGRDVQNIRDKVRSGLLALLHRQVFTVSASELRDAQEKIRKLEVSLEYYASNLRDAQEHIIRSEVNSRVNLSELRGAQDEIKRLKSDYKVSLEESTSKLIDAQAELTQRNKDLDECKDTLETLEVNLRLQANKLQAAQDRKEDEGQRPQVLVLGKLQDPPKEPGNDNQPEKEISSEATLH